mgnify:CR=1 FL=1
MKNRLFYLIGVASLLCYTSTFTSCINGVDDEYLEQQQISGDSGDSENEGEELPDLNGDYGQGSDYELKMVCNGEELNGKSISLAVDENNETATFILAGAETDLETVLAEAIPGGIGGLVSGMGLKFISNSPIPGEKEVTIPNVSLYKNADGTSYKFEGESVQPTFTITYRGTIENEKLDINLDYELTNQKLAGTWKVAPASYSTGIMAGQSYKLAPLWVDWDSNVKVDAGRIVGVIPGSNLAFPVNTYPNELIRTVVVASGAMMGDIIGAQINLEDLIVNMLNSITAKSNGGMYAIYSYSSDLNNPQWSGVDGMPHNAMRYYYDPENPDERIYLELNSGFLMDIIKQLAGVAAPASRSTRADIRDTAKELVALLVPLIKDGIPCDYKIEDNNLTINIDGIVLRDILTNLITIINDPTSTEIVNGVLAGLGNFQKNVESILKTLPEALKYKEYDRKTEVGTGECSYVKLGMKFVKE